jgi:hypothetical protein
MKTNRIKKLILITTLAILPAFVTVARGEAPTPSKELLLDHSGFKLVTVTTPQQKEAVNRLAQGVCSAVQYNGKRFYVFPTATKDKFYVGKQAQFNAYKKALQQGAAYPEAAYGPPPANWESVTIAYIKSQLKDPYSAHIRLAGPPVKTGVPIRNGFGKTVPGYVVYGYVNAKNGFGGYVGEHEVLVYFLNGQPDFALL